MKDNKLDKSLTSKTIISRKKETRRITSFRDYHVSDSWIDEEDLSKYKFIKKKRWS